MRTGQVLLARDDSARQGSQRRCAHIWDVPRKRLPDWASLELSPSVELCGCGLGPSPVCLHLYGSGSASASVNLYKIHEPERSTEIPVKPILQTHSSLYQSFNKYLLNRYPWIRKGECSVAQLCPTICDPMN